MPTKPKPKAKPKTKRSRGSTKRKHSLRQRLLQTGRRFIDSLRENWQSSFAPILSVILALYLVWGVAALLGAGQTALLEPGLKNGAQVIGPQTLGAQHQISFVGVQVPVSGKLQVPILMYHHIGGLPPDADTIRKGLTVPTDAFKAQLDFLQRSGYQTITLDDLYRALHGQALIPRKSIVLTFDDGYVDNYTAALPLLAARRMHGTFFVISGFVGQPGYMDWTQIKDSNRRGIEIGSHTVSHVDLEKSSPELRHEQILVSKQTIERELGKRIAVFCYPAGRYNPDVINEVRTDGYELAVTTKQGSVHSIDSPYELLRLRISPTMSITDYGNLIQNDTPAEQSKDADPAQPQD